MAAVIESRTADASVPIAQSRIASVSVLTNMRDAEAVWRGLEGPTQLSTPYQRFDFQQAWQHRIGAQSGLRPFIIVACDAEHRPIMLLPLAEKHENGARVASYLGGKHVTFNMPLWLPEFAASATAADMDALLRGIRQHADKIDVLALIRQPQRWAGVANPMSLLPHQASTNDCPLLVMTPGAPAQDRISNSFRRRLKGKERKLQTLPGYRSGVAITDADITRVLDAFFTLKPLRMAEQKLPNVFADPGVEDFIRDACLSKLASGKRAIELHSLECDNEVIALFAGVADGNRFSMMFNTYTMSGNSKFSPGLILMRDIIDHYAKAGVTSLDLGIGSDDYKRLFCKNDEPIFDSFIPLTTRGKLAAIGLSSFAHCKRLVKQTPALLQMAQMLRNAFR